MASGVAIALATLLGSMGAWISALAWARRVGQTAQADDDSVVDAELPISNRLFRIGVLVAVIAVVLGTCLGIAYLIQLARETARRNECRSNLRQIALCLHNYRDAHRHLPPAYITDKTGKPVLSWRVAAARHCYYDTDFSEFLDYDQPWNSPKNAKFLNHLGGFLHCPSSGKKPENPLTDYVAVVGPDTLWPGEQPGDLKKHPKGILVVEWPRSDIHWAEPRDITVEEFLDWFRAKPAKPDSFHPGCLLYVDAEGNVGELRNDTDTEIVRRLLVGQSTVGAASPAPSQ
ncbi:MAG: DUF1559 domain-containing protein [Pirellulales bacterium]|nr:DUF1559 domain-containing protein [Pirellulales bacterium]